ncbi:MAG: JAB domain-containing protein, partial [Nitrospinota bacterium]
ELTEIDGIGPTNAFGIKFIHEVARKFLRNKIFVAKNYMESFNAALEYYTHKIGHSKNESVHAIYLDSQNLILHEEKHIEGSISAVAISIRLIVEKSIGLGASAVVLIHNHPGGIAKPSRNDILFTKELFFAAKLVDLELRDHIIITATGHYSFYKEKLIDRFNDEFVKFSKNILGYQSYN